MEIVSGLEEGVLARLKGVPGSEDVEPVDEYDAYRREAVIRS